MGQMELQDELGKGAYGAVKKVLHRPTNVTMAMKVRLAIDVVIHIVTTSTRKFGWSSTRQD